MMYLVQLTNKQHEKRDSQDNALINGDKAKYSFYFVNKSEYYDTSKYRSGTYIDEYYASRYDKVGRFE